MPFSVVLFENFCRGFRCYDRTWMLVGVCFVCCAGPSCDWDGLADWRGGRAEGLAEDALPNDPARGRDCHVCGVCRFRARGFAALGIFDRASLRRRVDDGGWIG